MIFPKNANFLDNPINKKGLKMLDVALGFKTIFQLVVNGYFRQKSKILLLEKG